MKRGENRERSCCAVSVGMKVFLDPLSSRPRRASQQPRKACLDSRAPYSVRAVPEFELKQFSKRIFSCTPIATTKQCKNLRRAFATITKRSAFGKATAAAAAATSSLTMSPKSPRVSCAAICSGWERGDVFELQKESGGHALCALCEELLGRRSCFELDAASLTAFSAVLERDYGDNPYHNSVHGADALLTTQLFMHTTSLWVCCSRLQRLATLRAGGI